MATTTTTSKSITNKIDSVRTVVANYSNDEIVLVLENNDYDVDQTISDFIEGHANTILTEWHHAINIKTVKSKKRKAQKKQRNNIPIKTVANKQNSDNVSPSCGSSCQTSTNPNSVAETDGFPSLDSSKSERVIISKPTSINNSDETFVSTSKVCHHCSSSTEGNNLSKEDSSNLPNSSSEKSTFKKPKRPTINHKEMHKDNISQSVMSFGQGDASYSNKKGIEKVARDLQRCTVSFERYRNVLSNDNDECYKLIKKIFEQLSSALMDREVELMRMLDTRKDEAYSLLHRREQRANGLRRRTERVASMSQQELNQLRSEIKQFVADRKLDEEVCQPSHFIYDASLLETIIPNFGEISSSKNTSSTRTGDSQRSNLSASSSISSLIDAYDDLGLRANGNAESSPDKESELLNWADSVGSPPTLEARVSWASDVPVISRSVTTQTHKTSNSYYEDDQSQRNANHRFCQLNSHSTGSGQIHGREDFKNDSCVNVDIDKTSVSSTGSGDNHRNFNKGRYTSGYPNRGYQSNRRGWRSYRGRSHAFYPNGLYSAKSYSYRGVEFQNDRQYIYQNFNRTNSKRYFSSRKNYPEKRNEYNQDKHDIVHSNGNKHQ